VNIERITLDLDSTVITRAGAQQGSTKGLNPLSRGRNSHHPLIAFVSQTRMVANAWLRSWSIIIAALAMLAFLTDRKTKFT